MFKTALQSLRATCKAASLTSLRMLTFCTSKQTNRKHVPRHIPSPLPTGTSRYTVVSAQ